MRALVHAHAYVFTAGQSPVVLCSLGCTACVTRTEIQGFRRYDKSYDELNSSEKQSVGGTKGGRARAEGAGSEGMAEMGKQGGNVTKDDTSSW